MAQQLVKQFRHREIAAFLKSHPQAHAPLRVPNPFLPSLSPETGRWAPARYSLRRQADLVHSARKSGLVHLLPPGPKLKLSEWRDALGAQGQTQTVEVKAGSAAKEVVGEEEAVVETESTKVQPRAGKTPRKELWALPVEWEGTVKERVVPGADVGNRLYAGKWRMFKGHKWERTREKRLAKRSYLLKGMKARIKRFKTTYRKKMPHPLAKPRHTAKAAKLPF